MGAGKAPCQLAWQVRKLSSQKGKQNKQGPCRFIRRVNKLLARLAMCKLLHLPRKVAGAERHEKG